MTPCGGFAPCGAVPFPCFRLRRFSSPCSPGPSSAAVLRYRRSSTRDRPTSSSLHALLSTDRRLPPGVRIQWQTPLESKQAESSALARAMLHWGSIGGRRVRRTLREPVNCGDAGNRGGNQGTYGLSEMPCRLSTTGSTRAVSAVRAGCSTGEARSQRSLTYLCYVGALVAWQGLPFIVDALSELDPSVHLFVVGDGPMREELDIRVDRLGLRTASISLAGFRTTACLST